MLDVRVCVSREQGLRILLFQFLKRNHGGQERVGAAAVASEDLDRNDRILALKPHIARFIEDLKTHLEGDAVTLSSLYDQYISSVCSLDTPAYGLCVHYYMQLSAMYNQAMLRRLKQPMLAMEEWSCKMERCTGVFVTMLRPMLEKEHGLTMPGPEEEGKEDDEVVASLGPAQLPPMPQQDDESIIKQVEEQEDEEDADFMIPR